MGAWNFLYFLPIVFIASFYLVNLMLAVVALTYNIEVERKKVNFQIVIIKVCLRKA